MAFRVAVICYLWWSTKLLRSLKHHGFQWSLYPSIALFVIIASRFGMNFLTIYFNIWEGRCLPRKIRLSDVTFSPESTGQFLQGKFQGPGLNHYSKQEDGLHSPSPTLSEHFGKQNISLLLCWPRTRIQNYNPRALNLQLYLGRGWVWGMYNLAMGRWEHFEKSRELSWNRKTVSYRVAIKAIPNPLKTHTVY